MSDIRTGAENWPIATATCCRQWPVAAFTPLRRCGYCGQVPEVTEPATAS